MTKPEKSFVLYKNRSIKCTTNPEDLKLLNSDQKIDTIIADCYDDQNHFGTCEIYVGYKKLNTISVVAEAEYLAPFFMQCMINEGYEWKHPYIILSFNSEQKTIMKIRFEIEKA